MLNYQTETMKSIDLYTDSRNGADQYTTGRSIYNWQISMWLVSVCQSLRESSLLLSPWKWQGRNFGSYGGLNAPISCSKNGSSIHISFRELPGSDGQNNDASHRLWTWPSGKRWHNEVERSTMRFSRENSQNISIDWAMFKAKWLSLPGSF